MPVLKNKDLATPMRAYCESWVNGMEFEPIEAPY
jgi:hypothetical protein